MIEMSTRITGEMPLTSLWMTSKYFGARLSKLGKGRVLLLPNLQVEQSNEAAKIDFYFPVNQNWKNETTH